MKKVLIVYTGDNFPEGIFEYAHAINREEEILLKGFFLPTIDYSRLSSFAYANAYESGMVPVDFFEDEEKGMDKSIALFERACKKNNIMYKVYKQTGFEALQGLLNETRFSDLCLAGSEHFLAGLDNSQPNMEMSRFLYATECPVLLVPKKFHAPKELIFAYDGGASCMVALKQFSMLMTKYSSRLPLTVVHFASPGEDTPNSLTVAEYIGCHFHEFTIKALGHKKDKNLDEWLLESSNPWLITGAFSRSGLSRVFKKSFVTDTINRHKIPLFIFHSKNS